MPDYRALSSNLLRSKNNIYDRRLTREQNLETSVGLAECNESNVVITGKIKIRIFTRDYRIVSFTRDPYSFEQSDKRAIEIRIYFLPLPLLSSNKIEKFNKFEFLNYKIAAKLFVSSIYDPYRT